MRLKMEGLRDTIFRADALEDLACESADRTLIPHVRVTEPARHHSTDVRAMLQQHHRSPRAVSGNGSCDTCGRGSVDEYVRKDRCWLCRSAGFCSTRFN